MWCFGDAKSKISNACLVWNTPAHDLVVGLALDIDINLLYLTNLSDLQWSRLPYQSVL